MGGSVAAAAAPAGGSFLGTAGFGTAATDCCLVIAAGAGACGFCNGLVTGRDCLAAEVGERGITCVRYTGAPVCCDPASVPVRICAGLCMAMAETPNRAHMLQIVRGRNIALLKYLEISLVKYLEISLDFTPPAIRTAAQKILARLILRLSAGSKWNIVIKSIPRTGCGDTHVLCNSQSSMIMA